MDPFFAISAFAFGLLFGSFLNVCIYRLPRDLSVVLPGSACPKCEKPIAFYDNVPVLSWIFLRGRCRNCHTRITPRYAIVELLCGGIFLACYVHFGLTLALLKYCVFGFLLLGLIFTDAETQLLPDVVTARALAPMPELLNYVAPFVEKGAKALLLKGQDVADELTHASKYWRIDAELVPSQTDAGGRIVVIRGLQRLG